MTRKINIYKIASLFFLLACIPLLSSCLDDDLIQDEQNPDSELTIDGEALKFFITVDELGGDEGLFNPNKALENYIDPDKVRVLFFTEDDKFLFESKSRWIKKSSTSDQTGFYTWEILVPFFTHGNDQVNEYNWPWEDIREYMTQKPFKIAIMANRPEKEWNMGIIKKGPSDWTGNSNTQYNLRTKRQGTGNINNPTDVARWENEWLEINASNSKPPVWYTCPLYPYGRPLSTDTLVKFGWFGNHGPYWTKENSYKIGSNNDNSRDVFDLHHCQYDPIYDGKNWDNGTLDKNNPNSNYEDPHYSPAQYIGFYNHISEMYPPQEGQQSDEVPWMGATSSWIDWGDNDDLRAYPSSSWSGVRRAAELTEDHPIPMYGIQLYAPLETWEEGTTFNLGRKDHEYVYDGKNKLCLDRNDVGWDDKAISLLRSVVKLELVIPGTSNPDYVVLSYTNIYARCEPVDTWTPTELIWSDDHDDDCEWKRILKYGPMVHGANYGGTGFDGPDTDFTNTRDVKRYQKRLSWFYGAWKEKLGTTNFTFTDPKSGFTPSDIPDEETYGEYPRVFNTCIQRNNNVYIPETMRYFDGANWHYIVYMGEKNINDPTNLSRMGNTSSGSATLIYWSIGINGTVYSFPIVENPIDNPNNMATEPYGFEIGTDGKSYPSFNTSSKINLFGEVDVADGKKQGWPLIRNHVYRMYTNGTRSGFSVRGEMKSSRTINFNDKLFKSSKPDVSKTPGSTVGAFVK